MGWLAFGPRSRNASAMNPTFVFGYGSLVNRATHDYAQAHPARASGWRRVWRHVEGRTVAFLTVERAPGSEIDGLIAEVATDAWPLLDVRERSYLREPALDVFHSLGPDTNISIYHAPPDLHRCADRNHPILLSYLDVVVQGFAREFGEEGVTRFFESTEGWDAAILNDRAAPRYSRHQTLTADERALTDDALARVGAVVFD